MYFRANRKSQGDISLYDTLEAAGDGDSLSLADVLTSDEDITEGLDQRDACSQVRKCVNECLGEREKEIITLRYGLNDQTPRTQREVAKLCGISRSYVSRRRYCKRKRSTQGLERRGLVCFFLLSGEYRACLKLRTGTHR